MSTSYQPVDDYPSYHNHAQGGEHFSSTHITDNDPAHKPAMTASYWPVDSHASYQYSQDNNQFDNTVFSDNVPLHNLPCHDQFGDARSYPVSNGEKQGDSRKPRAPKDRVLPRLWMWELMASAFSLVCIAVIVVVLLNEDGKRLDGWALMISPNAVISFITTLAKSSCLLMLAEVIGQLRWLHFATAPRRLSDVQLFDAGSRGPWGALQLMFRMKTAALLASSASLLTIAALVIDPFAQLVFTFPTRPTPTPLEAASIRLAHVYDANSSVTANHGPPYPVAQNAPFQLQSAVISAAFGTSPDFDLTCPTSNCTFPPVSTLGICSTCEDVVDATNTTCGRDKTSGATVCNTTVPRQLLPPSRFAWSVSSDAAGEYADVWNSSSVPATPNMVTMYTGYGEPAVLAAFTALKLDRNLFRGNNDRPTKPSQVNQCMFAYCLKTYNHINVSSGRTNIGPVDEKIMHISSHEFFLDPPQTGNFLFTMQTFDNGQTFGPNYTMNWFDHLNLGVYMKDVLNSTVFLNTGTYQPGAGGRMAPSFGLAMYNAENLTVRVGQIADSMTNSMRNSQNNFTTVTGTAFVQETYIHIEWKWLSLPIAVSVLSLVLLITVMINSKSHGVEGKSVLAFFLSTILKILTRSTLTAWKSSSLPLLFYGLEGWDSELTRGFKNAEDLQQRAKAMKGQVTLDSDHPVFLRDGLYPTDGTAE
ncbi:hypothetical protein PG994_002623 [Apiospora phragmitis]|uniref:Uncharacterized protein n=1 Tax=Apiospora phragmitis TaxID=2905665 RepID=A0ABR1W8E9_9PEZI